MAQEEYIRMMIESLEKKVGLLEAISEIDKHQSQVLTDPNATPDEFFETMDDKQEAIDEIDELNDGFTALLEKVKPELERNKEAHRNEIARMQDLIRRITDLSAKVQSEEQENYKLATKKFSDVRQQVKKIRKSQAAVSRYYRTMSGAGYDTGDIGSQYLNKRK